MDDDGLAQLQTRLFAHFPDGGINRGLAIIYGARHEVVAERVFAGDLYAGTKLVPQHYLVTLRVIAEDSNSVATLHHFPLQNIGPAVMLLNFENIPIHAEKPVMQEHSLANFSTQRSG